MFRWRRDLGAATGRSEHDRAAASGRSESGHHHIGITAMDHLPFYSRQTRNGTRTTRDRPETDRCASAVPTSRWAYRRRARRGCSARRCGVDSRMVRPMRPRNAVGMSVAPGAGFAPSGRHLEGLEGVNRRRQSDQLGVSPGAFRVHCLAVVSMCSNERMWKSELLDHLVATSDQRRWHSETERPRSGD